MKLSLLRVAVLAGIAAVALSLTASPASAAGGPPELAPGSQLFALDCNLASLYTVDSATAAATLVSTASNTPGDCARGAAWDPAGEIAYFSLQSGSGHALMSVDLTTGVETRIANFDNGGGNPVVTSIAIDPVSGAAYAYGTSGYLWSLDLDDATLTLIGPSTTGYIWALAFQPATHVLYAVESGGTVSTVNTSNGVLTPIGALGIPSSQVLSLQIDASGVFWVDSFDNSTSHTDLWSFNPVDFAGSGLKAGQILQNGSQLGAYTLLIKPGTAATSAMSATSTITSASFGSTGMRVTFTGFLPGEPLTISFGASSSSAAVVAHSVADSDGNGDITYQLANAADSDYAITATGDMSGLSATTEFTVGSAAVVTLPAAVPARSPAVVTGLAETGVDVPPVVAVSGLLLLAGVALGLVSRRPPRAVRSQS